MQFSGIETLVSVTALAAIHFLALKFITQFFGYNLYLEIGSLFDAAILCTVGSTCILFHLTIYRFPVKIKAGQWDGVGTRLMQMNIDNYACCKLVASSC